MSKENDKKSSTSETNEALLKYAEELEKRVSARTNALGRAVSGLEKEIGERRKVEEQLQEVILEYENLFKKYEIDEISSIIVEVPDELKLSLQQYILFFKEYIRNTKGYDTYFEVIKSNTGLRIDIKPREIDDFNLFNEWFNEYLDFIRKANSSIQIAIKGDISPKKIEIFTAEMKNQIRHLESQLEIANLKNRFLSDENSFLRNLSLNLSNSNRVLREYGYNDISEFKLRLKKMLSNGKVYEVLKDLTKYLKSENLDGFDDLILINSKLSQLNLECQAGVISKDEERIERQKIVSNTLGFINQNLV